jgi:SAM-dependent methyltransferase
MTDRPEQVAALWGNAEFTHQLAQLQWMASPVVQLHLNERSTGSAARDWLTAWAPRFFPGGPLRVLVLGCGEGWLERALSQRRFIEHIEAVDLAADAVARARDQAAREGIGNIDYQALDLNIDTLPANAYDVIIAHSILHHVERLEHAFEQIGRALKPQGTFILNEYAGPARFQFSDQVLAIINGLLRAIPERLRKGTIEKGVVRVKRKPSVEEVINSDPSEAVRSDELLPLTGQRFEIIDRIDLGGTILQHVLYDLVPNFPLNDSVARSILELMCIFESALVDAGAIPSDYVLVAARKKGAAPMRPDALTLPPLPPEGLTTISDPLGLGPKRTLSRARDSHGPRRLSPWILRSLRVGLLAQERNRSILNPDSPIHRAIEKLRFALRRERYETAFDHVIARLAAGNEVIPMLEALERIAIDTGVV